MSMSSFIKTEILEGTSSISRSVKNWFDNKYQQFALCKGVPGKGINFYFKMNLEIVILEYKVDPKPLQINVSISGKPT